MLPGDAARYRAKLTAWSALAIAVAGVAGCARGRGDNGPDRSEARYGVASSPRMIEPGRPVPRGGGVHKIGSPYQIAGRWYVPRADPGYDAAGVASWYGTDFHGRKTANGEIFDMGAITAAHPTLPLPSYVYVTNLTNGRTLLVRVNDRGPYAHDRIIDLSKRSAQLLGFEGQGLARVRVRYAGPAPLDGNDQAERRHLATASWAVGGPDPGSTLRAQARLDR